MDPDHFFFTMIARESFPCPVWWRRGPGFPHLRGLSLLKGKWHCSGCDGAVAPCQNTTFPHGQLSRNTPAPHSGHPVLRPGGEIGQPIGSQLRNFGFNRENRETEPIWGDLECISWPVGTNSAGFL